MGERSNRLLAIVAVASIVLIVALVIGLRGVGQPPPSATPGASVAGGTSPSASAEARETATATAESSPSSTPPPSASQSSGSDPVLVGAGDISTCSNSADTATAEVVRGIDGTVFTAGDNAYESGTRTQYANCYGPTWGQFVDRTRPAPGNHEYETKGAAGYFDYFGEKAGRKGEGYYAFDLGTWRIYSLNSNCDDVSCKAGSPQATWLEEDLAANPRQCVLAYWHHPLFSSGQHGNQNEVRPLFQILYDHHADVVINGHDHLYERFDPQTPRGEPTPTGIREFVVGTGGRSHYRFEEIQPNSVVRNNATYGVMKLTLHAASYSWEFVPVAGSSWTDEGTADCV